MAEKLILKCVNPDNRSYQPGKFDPVDPEPPTCRNCFFSGICVVETDHAIESQQQNRRNLFLESFSKN